MEPLVCPTCGSGQVRSSAGGKRKRCRRCGYGWEPGSADGTPVLPPCPVCGSNLVFLRFDGKVVCRACRLLQNPEPSVKQEKHEEPTSGAARLQQLIREARERTRHPIIKSG